MDATEIKAKIAKINAMSGISDKAKADMVKAWEKKLDSLEKDSGKIVPGFKKLRQDENGRLTVDSQGEFIERWVPLVAENLKLYTGLSKKQNIIRFKSELTGEKSKAFYEQGTSAHNAARFLQQDKESDIGKASDIYFSTNKQPRKPRKDKGQKPKMKSTFKFKGKNVSELDEKECEEMLRETKERRKKAAASEKKSKSRPIIEKIATPVVKAVKKAIDNIPVADLKDNPKGELSKITKAIAATKRFLSELKAILGEDFDKDTVDGELKELHALSKELHKKYGE